MVTETSVAALVGSDEKVKVLVSEPLTARLSVWLSEKAQAVVGRSVRKTIRARRRAGRELISGNLFDGGDVVVQPSGNQKKVNGFDDGLLKRTHSGDSKNPKNPWEVGVDEFWEFWAGTESYEWLIRHGCLLPQ
jgi:hypothetical protein